MFTGFADASRSGTVGGAMKDTVLGNFYVAKLLVDEPLLGGTGGIRTSSEGNLRAAGDC